MSFPVQHHLSRVYKKTTSGLPVVPQLGVLLVFLLMLFGGAIGSGILTKSEAVSATESTRVQTTIPTPAPVPPVSADTAYAWDEIDITATAAYVWDVKNQRALYTKNSEEVLPLASITKLMTALLAHELLNDDVTIPVGETAARQDGGTFLHPDDRFRHDAIASMALIASANDGAYALAAAAGEAITAGDGANAFVQAMNIRAKELDLYNTSFRNPTGLDISETEAGSYSTAKEATFLMEYLLAEYPELLAKTTKANTRIYDQNGSYYDIENTNHYLNQIPNVLGSKTGYTDLAGGNLVVAFNAGLDRPIIITVLNSTWSERFTDVLTLVAATQEALKAH